nr:hypothetical protein KPHV_81310 [Kitasatospora purpeofusca]
MTGPEACSADPSEPQAAAKAVSDVSAMARVAALNGRDFMGRPSSLPAAGGTHGPDAAVGEPADAAGC